MVLLDNNDDLLKFTHEHAAKKYATVAFLASLNGYGIIHTFLTHEQRRHFRKWIFLLQFLLCSAVASFSLMYAISYHFEKQVSYTSQWLAAMTHFAFVAFFSVMFAKQENMAELCHHCCCCCCGSSSLVIAVKSAEETATGYVV